MGTVDEYFRGLDETEAAAFARVLEVALEEAPDADQGTSYGMAALRHHGKPLLGFRAAATHLAVFPFSPAAVEAATPLLDGFSLSKGTVRFTPADPVPDDAVRAMVRQRCTEIDGG